MPIIVTPFVPPVTPGSDDLSGVVRPGIPEVDGCPIFTRINAFVVDQTSVPTLEYTFRRKSDGNPIDLSSLFGTGGDSISSPEWTGALMLRVREALGFRANGGNSPLWDVPVQPHLPSEGIVRAQLSTQITANAGVYRLSWAILNEDGGVILVNDSLLSVERNGFFTLDTINDGDGPMTIGEVRLALNDSSGTENVRLGAVEYSDEEIIYAIGRPIEYWNEALPPLKPMHTTRDFHYRYNWRQGTIAQLYLKAAAWYRRNKQQIRAGGLDDDDLNRDKDYEAKGVQLWKEYTDWVTDTKTMINYRLVAGAVGSQYGGRGFYY